MEKYRNPIFERGADPWMIRVNEKFYYTCTSGDRIALRSAEHLLGLSKSRPVTVWMPPEQGAGSRDLWAPELHFLNGSWYIYYAASDGSGDAGRRMHVLRCTGGDPMIDVWEHAGVVNTARPGLDGTVLLLNGEMYFIYAGYGDFPEHGSALYIAKMDSPQTLTGAEVCLTEPEYEWERQGGMPINEGPAILRRNGSVFLVYSASTTWSEDYCLGMLSLLRGADPMDSAAWKKSASPVFVNCPERRVLAPGHNCFCECEDGTALNVYHAIEGTGGQGDLDMALRSPRVQQVYWRADGTPDFGMPVAVGK